MDKFTEIVDNGEECLLKLKAVDGFLHPAFIEGKFLLGEYLNEEWGEESDDGEYRYKTFPAEYKRQVENKLDIITTTIHSYVKYRSVVYTVNHSGPISGNFYNAYHEDIVEKILGLCRFDKCIPAYGAEELSICIELGVNDFDVKIESSGEIFDLYYVELTYNISDYYAYMDNFDIHIDHYLYDMIHYDYSISEGGKDLMEDEDMVYVLNDNSDITPLRKLSSKKIIKVKR